MTQRSREAEPILRLEKVSKSFPNSAGMLALGELNLTLTKGEFLSVIGPSGCGKTTLLRIMAGLLPPTTGRVFVDGTEQNPRGNVVLVFQEYGRSLLPWRTVLHNVTLGLEETVESAREREERARQFLELVELHDFSNAYPNQLSGGMQQRVALARALVRAPRVLLMDEPFGSLDARTRSLLEDLLLRLWQELKLTIVFVTHDIDEAIYLSQTILLLSPRPGRVVTAERVGLPYPRDQITTREDSRFLNLRRKLYHGLHDNSPAFTSESVYQAR